MTAHEKHMERAFRMKVSVARDASGYATAHTNDARAQHNAWRACWEAADADPKRRHKVNGR